MSRTKSSPTNSVVERYNASARDYERWWAPVLEATSIRLIEYVEWYAGGSPPDGATVLDVGTGTGTLARAALERWPNVQLIASDAAAGMLTVARERTADVDGSRLTLVEGAAAALPLADQSVDLVISSFVFQLVPDRLAALRDVKRLLKPAGVIAYVTWIDDGDYDFEPRAEFDEVVLDLKIEEPHEGGDEVVAGDLASARAAATQLRRAGFREAVAREDELEYDWTLESYLEYKFAYDECALLSVLDSTQREELEAGARQRLAKLPPEAFRWRPPIVFAAARKSQ